MTVFTDKAQRYVPRLMKDLSITKVQACGIFGNIGGETGGFAALQERAPIIKGSRGGYGWLQWTGPRRKKYEAWCKTQNLDPAADETNYRYLVLETTTDEAHSLVQLKKTTTIETATETFMKQNLRPGKPNLPGRIDWARKAFVAVTDQVGSDVKTGVVAGTVLAGGAVAAASPQHVWVWIAVGTAVVAGLAWLIIHSVHEQEKQAVVTPTKKGKKYNG